MRGWYVGVGSEGLLSGIVKISSHEVVAGPVQLGAVGAAVVVVRGYLIVETTSKNLTSSHKFIIYLKTVITHIPFCHLSSFRVYSVKDSLPI